ncbi:MAG: hypothetical protein ACXWLH_00580 [Candidatus Saccharimonadales bacterium]
MNIDISKIIEKLTKGAAVIKRYRVITFVIFLALVYGFLVFRINSLSGQQPSDAEVSAKLKNLSSPRIDQSVVDKIQQLQDNSVQVKSLFNQARKNPFSE